MGEHKIYSPQDLLNQFDAWGLNVSTIAHEAVFTTDQACAVVDQLPGAHCKSLFVKNKKDQYFLIVVRDSSVLDLNSLSAKIGGGRLSFCSEERLWEKLRVRPGSVTPFALIQPTATHIQLILEAEMMAYPLLNYHPLINTKTTTITNADFKKFLDNIKCNPIIEKLPLRE